MLGSPQLRVGTPRGETEMDESIATRDLAEEFKLAMRLLAATVTVVTAEREGTRSGLTATAVCSLTMAPPNLLVCINRASHTHDFILRSGRFRVNLLAADQQHVAEVFSGAYGHEGEDRFTSAGIWEKCEAGIPARLAGALASALCVLHRRFEIGTHSIFIGRVEDVHTDTARRPLIYANRQFMTLAA
jgi:flavin reductase (DIM6/NTAB) family NADH-FMN oxidoreductase RutF